MTTPTYRFDQIAAEAWHQITHIDQMVTPEKGIAIIKSAIEKAMEQDFYAPKPHGSRAAHASEQGADTKRLDWAMNAGYPHLPKTREELDAAIIAALSQRPKLKEITIEDATFGDLEA